MSVPGDYPGIAVRFTGDPCARWEPVVAEDTECIRHASDALDRAWLAYKAGTYASYRDAVAVASEWILEQRGGHHELV